MLARGCFSPAELTELEDHILEEAGRLIDDGRSDDDAFLEALRRLGSDRELGEEFQWSHEQSGAPVGVRLAALIPVCLRVSRFLRGLLILCLPGFTLSVPMLVLATAHNPLSDIGWDLGIPGAVNPVSGFLAALSRPAILWWAFIALLIVLAPTLYRIVHLRDRTGVDATIIVYEDMLALRPLLLAGLLAYPVIGIVLCRIIAAPYFRIMVALGG